LCIIAVGQDDFCLKVGQELPVSCCLSWCCCCLVILIRW
jgi:hypothetical protein